MGPSEWCLITVAILRIHGLDDIMIRPHDEGELFRNTFTLLILFSDLRALIYYFSQFYETQASSGGD